MAGQMRTFLRVLAGGIACTVQYRCNNGMMLVTMVRTSSTVVEIQGENQGENRQEEMG